MYLTFGNSQPPNRSLSGFEYPREGSWLKATQVLVRVSLVPRFTHAWVSLGTRLGQGGAKVTNFMAKAFQRRSNSLSNSRFGRLVNLETSTACRFGVILINTADDWRSTGIEQLLAESGRD